MNLGRIVAVVTAATTILASGVVAQSPSPGGSTAPAASAIPSQSAASPVPSATPFPWPTIHRERLARGTFPDWPSGKPAASTTDRGIRLDLWLSTTEAAPGDWVQAIVRATNVGRDTAWVAAGQTCDPGTQTRVDLDLAPVVRMGLEQTGAAAAFKEHLVREADLARDHFRSPTAVLAPDGALTAVALAECATAKPEYFVEPLRPGGTRTERFYWRAAQPVPYGPRGRLQPLDPGTVPVTVRWALSGRGARPDPNTPPALDRPVVVRSAITLTGDGPGTPSFPELIDAALAEPIWRAWVEQDRTGQDVVSEAETLRGPFYPVTPATIRRLVLDGTAANGALELVLGTVDRLPDGRIRTWLTLAATYIDPWTGEVIGTWFRDPPA